MMIMNRPLNQVRAKRKSYLRDYAEIIIGVLFFTWALIGCICLSWRFGGGN